MNARKRKLLTYKEQKEVLKKIKSGVSKYEILREFEISNSAYYRLLDREPVVSKNTIENLENTKKKSSKLSDNRILDTAMIKWFQQARDRGEPISGPILCEKAILMNKKFNGPSTFKVSEDTKYFYLELKFI